MYMYALCYYIQQNINNGIKEILKQNHTDYQLT